jgi:superfamily II DNA or RNA helicase
VTFALPTFDAFLQDALADDQLTRRGTRFEAVIRDWLLITPTLPVRNAWLWEDATHLPFVDHPDCGVDIIAELDRPDGTTELMAVQVKCYAPTTAVKKSDIDSFLTESSGVHFARRLLVTTGPVSSRAANTMDSQPVVTEIVDLETLRESPVTWPAYAGPTTAPARLPRATPRPHQDDALAAIVPAIAAGGRLQAHMACGSGKSLTALWSARQSGASTILLLAPAINLISQLLDEWQAQHDWDDVAFLPVCSDTDIKADDRNASDEGRPPSGATTDPAVIAAFLDGPAATKVVLSTYQSSHRVAAALEASLVGQFDLAICDEAHRLAGRPSPAFATVLDDDALPCTARLFLTATPRIITGRANRDGDIETFSMNDPNAFGSVVYTLSFRDALEIDPPLLAPYRVVVVGVTDEGLVGGDVSVDGRQVPAELVAKVAGIRKTMDDHNLSRVITYWSRTNRAAWSSGLLEQLETDDSRLGLHAEHVTGAHSMSKRKAALARLASPPAPATRSVLANARCLTEGVNVPSVDGVVFGDPRKSVVDVVQAVGRAMRHSPGKTRGVIVVPLLVPPSGDPADIDPGAFRPVWEVLAALASQDKLLEDRLTLLRRTTAERPLTRADLEDVITFDGALGDMDTLVDAIVLTSVEAITASWWTWLEMLHAWITDNPGAHVSPAKNTVINGHPLGQWCGSQRAARKAGQLTTARVAALDDLGFIWDPHEQAFADGLAALTTWITDNPGAPVSPAANTVINGRRLGAWCNTQKNARKAGRLTDERIAALDNLGFIWDALEQAFADGLAALATWITDNPGAHVSPAKNTVINGHPLGQWCNTQKNARKAGRLTDERIAALDNLGFIWGALEQAFADGIAALTMWIADNAGAPVSPGRNTTVNGHPLGQWCNTQKKARKAGRLTDERIAALDALGFIWDPWEQAFDDGLAALTTWISGNPGVPVSPAKNAVIGGYRLGTWCGSQKNARKAGRLTDERIAALDNLGFIWDAREQAFAGGIAALTMWISDNAGAPVSPADNAVINGHRLGAWCSKQREARKAGRLAGERIAALDNLGFCWVPRSCKASHCGGTHPRP